MMLLFRTNLIKNKSLTRSPLLGFERCDVNQIGADYSVFLHFNILLLQKRCVFYCGMFDPHRNDTVGLINSSIVIV